MENLISGKRILLFSLCGAGILSGCTPKKDQPERQVKTGKPNVIYLYFDDLGYGELGCYGQKKN